MKRYELKIPIHYGEGKTFWKTIGTLFCADDTHLVGDSKKPASFVIDYPPTQGIVAPVEKKKTEKEDESEQPPI